MFKRKQAPSLKVAKVSASGLLALPPPVDGEPSASSCLPSSVSIYGKDGPAQLHTGITWEL